MSLAGTELRPRLDRLQNLALVVGGACTGVCLLAALALPRYAMPAYLAAYLFWVGIGLGCVSITMLHHLTGGTWGLLIRRPMEAGAMGLLPLAVLFLPIALGMRTLYRWTDPDVVVHSEAVRHKVEEIGYLTTGGFLVRAGVYLALWIVLAILLNRWSDQQDETEDIAPTRRLQRLSGPGLALVFLTASFAAIDWGMSLEPEWYSTMYGAMLIVGWGLSTFAAMVVVASLLARYEPFAHIMTPPRIQDLGNLMLAFTMLWAYLSFSQFLIIWSGDLAEEIPWYLRRTRGGWEWVALALIVFHFFAPFFALLMRETKRRADVILWVAVLVLVMHVVDMTWLVVPSQTPDPAQAHIPWPDLFLVPLAVVGIGGLWAWAFLWQLKGHPLIPEHDPDINPAAEHIADPYLEG